MRLGDLVLPTGQRDPRETPHKEFFYVDISSVDNEAKVIAATKRIVGVDAPSRARKIIRKGDVIVLDGAAKLERGRPCPCQS